MEITSEILQRILEENLGFDADEAQRAADSLFRLIDAETEPAKASKALHDLGGDIQQLAHEIDGVNVAESIYVTHLGDYAEQADGEQRWDILRAIRAGMDLVARTSRDAMEQQDAEDAAEDEYAALVENDIDNLSDDDLPYEVTFDVARMPPLDANDVPNFDALVWRPGVVLPNGEYYVVADLARRIRKDGKSSHAVLFEAFNDLGAAKAFAMLLISSGALTRVEVTSERPKMKANTFYIATPKNATDLLDEFRPPDQE